MRTKVYVNKNDRQSPIPGFVITLIFLGISIGIFVAFFKKLDGNYTVDGFFKVFSDFGMAVLFALVFFGFSLYFIWQMFASPKRYVGVLKSKQEKFEKNNPVTELIFEVQPEGKSLQAVRTGYKCYIKNKSDFQEGEKYILGIKTFNWCIKYVEDHQYDESSAQIKMDNASMLPVFMGILFIFGGGAAFLAAKIFYDINRGNNPAPNFLPLIILLAVCVSVFAMKNRWEKDTSLEQKQEKTGHGPDKGIESIPPISDPSKFSVLKETFSINGEKYMITDKFGNTVFNVKADPINRMVYSIVDCFDNEIGSIDHFISLTEKFTVRLNNERPFTVRKKMQIGTGYEISGLDYTVTGNYSGGRCAIQDLDGRLVADISVRQTASGAYVLGKADVAVSEEFQNNIYIMLISLCVVMGNLHSKR